MTTCNLWRKLLSLLMCDCVPARRPLPVRTRVARDLAADGWRTSIARMWRPSDVGRCSLCASCTADRQTGLCLVVARRYVSDKDAPLYAFRGEQAVAEKGGLA